ncbi:MAG: rhomboid family intramembrane serine protease [Bacteroidia bacterium]|nr:rhomboid family intramembrane serine protease [Bacteroidia bacterium]
MKNYLLKQIYRSILYPLLFVISIWVIYYFQHQDGGGFAKWGVLPRKTEGLLGIITSVFVHGDLGHIASNSLPMLVLGMMLFYFYRKIAFPVFLWIWLISGLWLWVGGRNDEYHPNYHIGASTLIYGLASFLFFSGVFRRHLQLMVVSALVLFLYGGIIWGIFPINVEMSWEGHLFGAIAGVMVAYNYRREGPQRKVYEWENEEEEEENPGALTVEGEAAPSAETDSTPNVIIHYIYKSKNDEGDKSL